VVRENLTSFEKDRISNISLDLNLKYDIVITCFYYLYEVFKTWETPFFDECEERGNRGMKKEESIKALVEKTERSLSSYKLPK